ncbi:MAG: hypothetical protein AAFY60_09120 [Myxococcota bacterium]
MATVYDVTRPVAGPGAFVGRELLVRSLLSGLDKGRNFVLAGGPGIGKTSTLLQVGGTLRLRWRRQPTATKLVPVYLDASYWPKDDANSVHYFWNAVVPEITHPQVVGENPLIERVELKLDRKTEPLKQLKAALSDLSAKLRGTSGWSRYALLLDNADILTERSHDRHLQMLLELAADETGWGPSALLFAGGRLLRESLRERRSPLRKARLMTMQVLRESEADSLILRGFPSYAERNRAELRGLSGNHPWVLTRLLAELERRGGAGDPRSLGREIAAEFEPLFARMWNELDMGRRVTYRGAYAAPEHALLQYAIDYRSPISVKVAERDLALRPLKEYAELLEYVGMAESQLQANTSQLKAGIALFNQWYAKRITQ